MQMLLNPTNAQNPHRVALADASLSSVTSLRSLYCVEPLVSLRRVLCDRHGMVRSTPKTE